ncbi:MAG: dihydroxy-acid dehydratase, partial [Parvularculaceae bacterium]
RAIVNAIVGLNATGGSTNHTIHLIAMARAAGVIIDWKDFSELSKATPLLARIYPNGAADVNEFHAAGGLAFIIRELLDAGFLHEDVMTAMGEGLRRYAAEPRIDGGELVWREPPRQSADDSIVRPAANPFSATGGLVLLDGNLGRAVIKVSAVKAERRVIEAPAIVFQTQQELLERFKSGALNRDFVAVVPFQGPKANGMPELHKLTPPLGVLQDKGYKVALLTDGRMSGASGKVPAAIHLSPEAVDGGSIAKIRDGDIIRLDTEEGSLEVKVGAAELQRRAPLMCDLGADRWGTGRELFAGLRAHVSGAEEGAMTFQLRERNLDG